MPQKNFGNELSQKPCKLLNKKQTDKKNEKANWALRLKTTSDLFNNLFFSCFMNDFFKKKQTNELSI